MRVAREHPPEPRAVTRERRDRVLVADRDEHVALDADRSRVGVAPFLRLDAAAAVVVVAVAAVVARDGRRLLDRRARGRGVEVVEQRVERLELACGDAVGAQR